MDISNIERQPGVQWGRGLGALVLAATLAPSTGAAGGDPVVAGAVTCRAVAPTAAASASAGSSRVCVSGPAVRQAPLPPTLIEVICAPGCELRAAAEAASAAARSADAAASSAAAASRREHDLRRFQLEAREHHAQWSRWLALVLGSAALVAGMIGGVQAGRRDGVRFSHHWGGFGGADGGWRVSPALVNLLVCALLAGAAVLLMLSAAPETAGVPAPTGEAPVKK